jgi:hypothetical protein
MLKFGFAYTRFQKYLSQSLWVREIDCISTNQYWKINRSEIFVKHENIWKIAPVGSYYGQYVIYQDFIFCIKYFLEKSKIY